MIAHNPENHCTLCVILSAYLNRRKFLCLPRYLILDLLLQVSELCHDEVGLTCMTVLY